MTDHPVYVLDTNVFIEAARRYYAFDFAPAFWEALVRHAGDGRLSSINFVKQEIERGRDDLAAWARSGFSEWFDPTDQKDVIQAYRDVMAWVQQQSQFSDEAKAEFASGADGWLIAYAKAKGRTLVTHEQFSRDVRRKVPIPNVCQAFGVQCADTFAMLRDLGVRFQLA